MVVRPSYAAHLSCGLSVSFHLQACRWATNPCSQDTAPPGDGKTETTQRTGSITELGLTWFKRAI